MAFAVSGNRTVLWDQIQYTGNPGDVGWLHPVAQGATIELSNDAWFEALETATSPRVTAPPLKCVSGSSSGFGCSSDSVGSSSGFASADPRADGTGVTVFHQASLGPFETVTLRATDSGALRGWLTSHGYAIQEDVAPIIDAYIEEQMDFIALRLNGTQPMQPGGIVPCMRKLDESLQRNHTERPVERGHRLSRTRKPVVKPGPSAFISARSQRAPVARALSSMRSSTNITVVADMLP